MMEDVYVRLRKHLDTFVFWTSESETMIQALKNRFMPEEAEIALLLGRAPKDISTLAKSSGMAKDGLRSILEKMADKELVYKQQKKKDRVTRDVYSLLPNIADLWDSSFAKGKVIELG
jgi:DNA-binding MarR family transcriptional regulator